MVLTVYGKNYHTGEMFVKTYRKHTVSGARLDLLNNYIRKSKFAKSGQVCRITVVVGYPVDCDIETVLEHCPASVVYDV